MKLSTSWEATQGDEEKIEHARKLACVLIASKGSTCCWVHDSSVDLLLGAGFQPRIFFLFFCF
ncbi:unnamed protein product [Prunus armeniaca]|uniref:Uncharacterized protein n=1 Tax=Prunus armeniaca TaxID=36596 RepID=A0A6J5WLU3_PRUAR|nr:unnamed protein product [Prunus armeniaca]